MAISDNVIGIYLMLLNAGPSGEAIRSIGIQDDAIIGANNLPRVWEEATRAWFDLFELGVCYCTLSTLC